MPTRLIVERTTRIAAPQDAVWLWHTRPGALRRLIPPWERVDILETDPGITPGGRAVLDVHLGPVPLRWVAVHRDVVPGTRFVDVQQHGPFESWVHEHEMTAEGDATILRDAITCVPPLGMVGGALAATSLRTRIDRLLQYRHATIAADLAAHAGVTPRHFVVSGATGFIGSALIPFLTTGGHRVTRLVRGAMTGSDVRWNPDRGELDGSALAGADAVINLAGANVAGRRWDAARKQELIDSRVRTAGLLARTLARIDRPPPVFVSISASGIYGDRGDEPLGDEAAPGAGFFPSLVQAWEGAAQPAVNTGIRVTWPRFGIVLSPAGGALERLLPFFRAGVGGPVGGGRQWFGWASIDDAVDILYASATAPALRGAFNAATPLPARNADLTRLLGRMLHRPALLPVPAAALRLLYGEMADPTILASARVLPELLTEHRFRYRHPSLEVALRHLLGR